MIKVFKITSLDFPNQHVFVKTAREVSDVVYTTVLGEEDADDWFEISLANVVTTISIEVIEMDEAEYDALEPIESFGE